MGELNADAMPTAQVDSFLVISTSGFAGADEKVKPAMRARGMRTWLQMIVIRGSNTKVICRIF